MIASTPPDVAFEFNGPQHHGPTERFPDLDKVLRQQIRDAAKLIICKHRGIHVVVVHPDDLSLEGMRRKVQGLLPLRSLEGHEPLIAYLERLSRRYRESVRHLSWPK